MNETLYCFSFLYSFICTYITTVTILCGLLVLLNYVKNPILRFLLYVSSFFILTVTAGTVVSALNIEGFHYFFVRAVGLISGTAWFWCVMRHKVIVDPSEKLFKLPKFSRDYVEVLIKQEERLNRTAPRVVTKPCGSNYITTIETDKGIYVATGKTEKSSQQWAARFALEK